MNEEEEAAQRAIEELRRVARRLELQDDFDEAVGKLCMAFTQTNQLLAKHPEHKALCARNHGLIAKVSQLGMQRQLMKSESWDRADPPGSN